MKPVSVLAAAILFLSVALGVPVDSRQAQREGAGSQQDVVGGLIAAGIGRGRSGPARPAPRNTAGRVLLQGANPKD